MTMNPEGVPQQPGQRPATHESDTQARSAAAAIGRVVAPLIAAALCACTHATADVDQIPTTATVVRVVDGDTIDVHDDTRGRLRVRLLGIDAPEVHKPGWSVGCYGPASAQFADRTLTGQRVALVVDPTQDVHDKYGRTLAYVELADGRDYSVEAAAAGMAHAYVYGRHPASRYPDIAAAEQHARATNLGLWGPPCNGHTESVPG